MRYEQVSLVSLVLHEVVQKLPGHLEPVLSDTPSNLKPDQSLFIQSRIRGTLAGYARPVVEESGLSKAPDLVRSYFAGDEDLVQVSRILAQHLQQCQPKISPSGIFIAAEATIEGSSALVLAKLEHERGVRANQTALPDGRKTFIVELLRDLLFTTGSKIFKVAVFPAPVPRASGISGWVVDNQSAGPHVAQYFMSTFLGCQLAEQSDVLTDRFHMGAQRWINGLANSEKKGRYEIALISELQSQQRFLSVDSFAKNHLDVADRDDFVAGLAGSGVASRPFEKDLRLVQPHLKNVRFDMDSGVVLIAPPSALEQGVVVVADNSDETSTITVTDRIQRLSSQGKSSKPQAPGHDVEG